MQNRKDCILPLAGLSSCIYLLLLFVCGLYLLWFLSVWGWTISSWWSEWRICKTLFFVGFFFFIILIFHLYNHSQYEFTIYGCNCFGEQSTILLLRLWFFFLINTKLISPQMCTKLHCADDPFWLFSQLSQRPRVCNYWTVRPHICGWCHALQKRVPILNQSKWKLEGRIISSAFDLHINQLCGSENQYLLRIICDVEGELRMFLHFPWEE